GDRAGASGAGAVDADEGAHRATGSADRADERQRAALPAAAGSQPGAASSDYRPGAASPALRGRHDPPEAAPGRRAGELQAGRTAVRAREAAYPASAAQEDPRG